MFYFFTILTFVLSVYYAHNKITRMNRHLSEYLFLAEQNKKIINGKTINPETLFLYQEYKLSDNQIIFFPKPIKRNNALSDRIKLIL